MSAWFAAFLLAAAGGPAQPSTSTGTPDSRTSSTATVFPYPMHVHRLDNGLTAVIVPMDVPGLLAYRSAVRTGARDEYEPGHTGFAHFFEHMMFRGTEKYPEDVYAEIVTRMGADSNAYTSTDITVYQLDVAAEDLEKVIEIESDRFANLAYSEPVFRTEAGAVYGEYRKSKSSPYFVLHEALRKAAYRKHTYAHTTIGFEKDIAAMPTMYDYSKSFFSRYYRPENVILVIAGDVEPEPTLDLLEQYYGDWKTGYVAPKIPEEPRQRKARRIDVSYPGRTLPMVAVAYKGDAFAPADRTWVASLVLADLAFGETSDIHRELVLDEQVVQRIGASAATDRDPGLWTITAVVKDPAKVDYVLERIDATVRKYREVPPSAEALQRARSHDRYDFLMGLDSPARVAAQVARIAGISGDPRAHERLYATMDQVTPRDVQAAAEKYLVQKQRTVAVLRGEQSGSKR